MSKKIALDRSYASFAELLSEKEILVCCGSGGVGKTTMAASIGAKAASEFGIRVLVLTVDPAKRLANALGLAGTLGNREKRVPDSAFDQAGVGAKGELWAAMLDTKQSWDDLINRHAPDEVTKQKILANPLYQNLTGRFVQSHDYIAVERLFDVHSSGRYDLIIVDTPPTRNAIDFLEAPGRMAEFFSSRLLRWLTAPARSRVLNFATKPFYQIADRILGSAFLEDIAEFFLLFQSMYDGFVERSKNVEALLHNEATAFMVVTTLETAPFREAEFFVEALRQGGFSIGALGVNRLLPDYLRDPQTRNLAREWERHEFAEEVVGSLVGIGVESSMSKSQAREATVALLESAASNFDGLSVVATREAQRLSALEGKFSLVGRVPYLDADVVDIKTLLHVADHLWKS